MSFVEKVERVFQTFNSQRLSSYPYEKTKEYFLAIDEKSKSASAPIKIFPFKLAKALDISEQQAIGFLEMLYSCGGLERYFLYTCQTCYATVHKSYSSVLEFVEKCDKLPCKEGCKQTSYEIMNSTEVFYKEKAKDHY